MSARKKFFFTYGIYILYLSQIISFLCTDRDPIFYYSLSNRNVFRTLSMVAKTISICRYIGSGEVTLLMNQPEKCQQSILGAACWQYCTCPAGTGQTFPLHIRINILCPACWQYCTCPAGTGQTFPLHIRWNKIFFAQRVGKLKPSCWIRTTCP